MSLSATLSVFVTLCLMFSFVASKEHIDLSFDIGENSAHWVSYEPFRRETIVKGYAPEGYWVESYSFSMSEHTSTHMDAPSHFCDGKWSVDQIPLSHLMGPGIVIDIRDKVAQNSTAVLSAEDVTNWIDENGPFPDGVIIFVRTGWTSRYGNQEDYFGSNTNDTSLLNYPGIGKEAAEMMASYEKMNGRKVFGVGIDGPTLDNSANKYFHAHTALLTANIYGLESVANLDKLPVKGFDVLVMPIKLRDGSGGPTRVVASLPGESAATTSSGTMALPLLTAAVAILHFHHIP